MNIKPPASASQPGVDGTEVVSHTVITLRHKLIRFVYLNPARRSKVTMVGVVNLPPLLPASTDSFLSPSQPDLHVHHVVSLRFPLIAVVGP